jgi:predicted CXXCH cytochrome family protein
VTTRRSRQLAELVLGVLAAVSLPGVYGQESSRVCAGCHREIWDTYRQTGMGRSFYRPLPDKMVGNFTKKNIYYHQPSASYFAMIRRGDEYYQRRYQLDANGQPIHVMEKRVDYIMGSGNHARTYLTRTGAGTLIELPLGWYAEKGGYWAMNPGYDRPDHDGFRRPITYDCMFCHNAYPKIPAGHEKPLAEPVYEGMLPEGIDCQRCHGSGSRHVQLAGTGRSTKEEIGSTIINPARLNTDRQLEICMSCHLETTSFPLPNALQRYERGPFSFRPGEPLTNFILNFDHAPSAGREDKFEIVSSAYRLRKSACFLKSNGKMLCTTCHNPHKVPRGQEAVQHYNGVCRECHGTSFDQRVAVGKHTDATNCVGCHMPKRRTEDVVHAVMTDHLIQRRKPETDLVAERAERQEIGARAYRGPVVPYYPATLAPTPENELYLAVAQVKQGSNRKAGITQLSAAIRKYSPEQPEWYLELAEALDSDGQLMQALPFYREAVQHDLHSGAMLQRLGTALRRSGLPAEATEALTQATLIDPERALTWHELGLAYRSLGKTDEAIAALAKALERDPDLPEAQNNLGILWLASDNISRAEAALQEAIRIKPEYADAHGNLAGLLMRAGRMGEAQREFQIALRLRPDDAEARYNYAMLLGRTGEYEGAQRELEASLRADPGFADAHELLGDLLMAKGEAEAALPHYREAVRVQSEWGRAQLSLGLALAAVGNRTEAILHFQKATVDSDAAVRGKAAQMLRQMGKEQ